MVDRKTQGMLGQLLEVAERYDDMVKAMKAVAECASSEKTELTIDERNLLSVAYKNAVGERRSSHRAISNWLRENKDKGDLPQIKQVKEEVEKELNKICCEVLDLLDKHMIPFAATAESKVFYLKMKGDYYRYKAEVAGDNKEDIKNSEAAYQAAFDVSEKEMSTTNPIRLGLALNFSVFYYEIKCSPKEARELAKKAFDDAIVDLESSNPETQKDSTLILQLLKDNLTLWTADAQLDGEGEGGEQVEQVEQTEQPTEK
ncbi:14-3-3-like protein [Salarias fasciatus]|uniref:14-3-3-like protein n=1 Tax=Salarias fasciatus TaxID=181472 RepID=A0A672HQF7_SALFA|nr:14-3-3-like protein [Salarias fasciatus]